MRSLLLTACVFFLAGMNEALAHGGSHPTPWPTPPPAPPDTPAPTPTPGPPPPPPPPPPGPVPSGQPRPTGGPGQPQGTGTPQGAPPSIEVKWKTWWEINKWRFTWTPKKDAVATSGEGEQGPGMLSEFLVKNLDHKYFDVRAAAALALGRSGGKAAEAAVPKLVSMASDPNPTVSESAILALGMIGGAQAGPALQQALSDQAAPHRKRAHAAVALGLMSEQMSARAMMDIVQKPKENDQVRASCMMGLALMKHEPATPLLFAFMGNQSMPEDLRAMAATALGKMGFAEVRLGSKKLGVADSLMQAFAAAKKDRKLRLSIIMALAAISEGDPASSEAIAEFLTKTYGAERNTEVNSFILVALAEISRDGKGREKSRVLFRTVLTRETNQSLLAFACVAAGLSGDRESIKPIRDLFSSKSNPDTKSAAAVALGLLKDVESTQLLLDTIAGKAEAELKGYCCISLGLMGARDNKEAMPQLRSILVDGNVPELRAAAAMGLTLLGESNAVQSLLKVVEEGNSYIRMSIIVAIGYFRDMSTVPALIRLFDSDTAMNDEIRAIIVTALGYIADASEKPVLKRLATHFNYELDNFDALTQIIKLL